ncbi:MAG: hypothetical protein ACUVTZ_10185 [Armatimonadota bacterium]
MCQDAEPDGAVRQGIFGAAKLVLDDYVRDQVEAQLKHGGGVSFTADDLTKALSWLAG